MERRKREKGDDRDSYQLRIGDLELRMMSAMTERAHRFEDSSYMGKKSSAYSAFSVFSQVVGTASRCTTVSYTHGLKSALRPAKASVTMLMFSCLTVQTLIVSCLIVS